MSNKNNTKGRWVAVLVVIAAVAAALFIARSKKTADNGEVAQVIKPSVGTIENYISSTGTVLPQNRLEIMPTVAGRVEQILVKEGDLVKSGQILGWMSSTERAALLDAAKGKGEEVLKYWEDAYKPIPLLAPIDGEVIVSTIQPGQTVATSDAIFVLSDRLIVRGQVDETDIGKIKLGQAATIALDAYPDTKISASVGHIYYESETVNNVTIYKVDLIPEQVPEFFRSGMNATVDFLTEKKENAILIPVDAVHKEGKEQYVLLIENNPQMPAKRSVVTGITDDKNYEVVSGLTSGDTVLITTKKYVFPAGNGGTGSNPFMPKMPSSKKGAGGPP